MLKETRLPHLRPDAVVDRWSVLRAQCGPRTDVPRFEWEIALIPAAIAVGGLLGSLF